MSLLRNATKSSVSIRAIKTSHRSPSLLRESWKRFSTETEAPVRTPATDSSVDPFFQTPKEGLVFGRLTGISISKHTLKTDIINLIEGCELTQDDVKVIYNREFMPTAMMVQFPSHSAFDSVFNVMKKNRFYRLGKADRSEWDVVMPYNGKTVLLLGIPRTAIPEDVERFLSGCEYEASSIQMLFRSGYSSKMATVHFPSQTQAMNAFIRKNRGFCLNNQITMRVLQ